MIARARRIVLSPIGYDRIVDFEKTIREMQDTLTVITESSTAGSAASSSNPTPRRAAPPAW
ncbi:MAG: hypothetical protein ACKV22_27850 [Bryobacteraceae bacterium]